jgi:hypothetical protein
MNYRDTIGYPNDTPVPKVSTAASIEAYLKALVSRGMSAVQGAVTTVGAAPTSQFYSSDLIGYGDNFFSGGSFYALVVQTTDGGSPITQMQRIDDYTSNTGWFELTGGGLSDNIDVGDQILILHESLAAFVQTNNDTSPFSSTSVEANEDGSVFERLEDIKNGAKGSVDVFSEVLAEMYSRSYVGSLTAADATGTENELFSHIPIGVAEPRTLKINLDNMAAGDAMNLKLYYQFTSGGGWVQEDCQSYGGADGGLDNGNKVISVNLDPNPYGVRVTLTQTDGTARVYAWFVVINE